MSDHRPGRPPWETSDRQPVPGRPRWRSRAALIGGGALVVATGVGVGLAATGGHNPSDSLSSGGTAPAGVPVAVVTASSSGSPAPWASESCPSQLSSWRGTGAGGQLQAVTTDVTILLQAATPLDKDLARSTAPTARAKALRSAATSLGSSTRAAYRNVIPVCISGAHHAEVAGLAALSGAVTGFDNVLSAVGSGYDQTAHRNIQTAITAMQSGSADMAKAMADLSRYGTK